MVECTECGARNSENSTFCVRCGAALVVAAEVAVSAPGSDTDRIAPVGGVAASPPEPDLDVQRTLVMATVPEPAEGPEALLAQAADLMGQGRPDEAAAKCREAIHLAPDMVAAYSMLGMAEEQRGNTIAAAGAYRRVLQLDPSRSAEREKLELLYASGVDGHHEPGPERGGDAGQRAWMARWAPLVVAAAGAFLVMVILVGVILHARGARAGQRTYEESMAAGEAQLDARNYAAASASFQQALLVRPDDRDARQGLDYAQRKLSAMSQSQPGAVRTAQAPGAGVMQPIVPSGGPNPFMPVPIGPTTGAAAPGVEQPQQAQQTRTRRETPRPPIIGQDETVVGTTGSSASSGGGPVRFENPLEDHSGGSAATPPPATAPGEGAATETERPRGEITIWVSDEPRPASGGGAATSATPRGTSQAQRAADLRSQADQLRAAGQCQAAAQSYDAAIEAYRSHSESAPGAREANQAAIKACERARSLCQTSQGQ